LNLRFATLTGSLLIASLCLLAGCSVFSSKTKNTALAQNGHWDGRLNLRILQKPPEQFSANFTLEGTAETGELTIYSPIGSTLAVASWNAEGATLTEGSKKQSFDSMEALTRAVTGANLPLSTLMTWLNVDGESLNGWEIRSENPAAGRRLFAKRISPLPQLQLTLILDPP